MTREELSEESLRVLLRAAEAGHFRDLYFEWEAAAYHSAEEDEATRKMSEAAASLVGEDVPLATFYTTPEKDGVLDEVSRAIERDGERNWRLSPW